MGKIIAVLIALLGTIAVAVGAFAICGAVFMWTAHLFGLGMTWVQGSALAASIKFAGNLFFSFPRGGA